METPRLIKGGKHIDERGILSFVNDFDLSTIKRLYTIQHPNKEIIRAWQGHKIEHKYFHVTAGSFVVAWVKIDDWELPSIDLTADYFILKSDEPCVLSVPQGYANGLKALEEDSQMIVFSSLTMEEAKSDQYRFENPSWFAWDKFKNN